MGRERCRVVVKCRPTFAHEEESLNDGIQLGQEGRVNVLGKEFVADYVYLPNSGDRVYEDEVQSLVASLYDGINSTVFAYGASGSGKTHTVLGSQESNGLADRITDEVFARYDPRSCTVSVSVEELYCERFTDLLAASAYPPASSIHHSSSGGNIFIGNSQHGTRGLHPRPPAHQRQPSQTKYSEQKVTLSSSTDMKEMLQHVLRKRRTASTCLNDKSSRSHVIITIALEQRKAIIEHKFADDEEPPQSSASSVVSMSGASSSVMAASCGSISELSGVRRLDSVDARSMQDEADSEAGIAAPLDTYLIGKLYLVDLAGSENIKRSGAEGARQKEAGEINKSLCHLKTVIEEVFKGGKVSTYRNSKLTYRLQDALGGGNSKLLVVACISTARPNLPETKETLRFAEMARAITNTPVVNRQPKDELIHELQMKLVELQDQLQRAKEEGGRAAATDEVLQELNVVEAAYADLKADMEAKEANWTRAAKEVEQQVSTLHSLLTDTQGREVTLRQQLAKEQAALQQLLQQLTAEQGARQCSQQAGAAAAALLLSMRQDMTELLQRCSTLQNQVEGQRASAAAAVGTCAEQQLLAHRLQQQLSAKAASLAALTQNLQQERAVRAAAEAHVADLQQQCCSLQQQLLIEQAATTAAVSKCTKEQRHTDQLQQQLDRQAQEMQLLRQQLQKEREARAAADAQVVDLQHQQHSIQAAVQECTVEASQDMQALSALCAALQEQVASASSQQLKAQQQHLAVLGSLQAVNAAHTTVEQQLEATKHEASQLKQCNTALQQQLKEQAQEHAAVLSAAASATAKAAADAAKEHLVQRQALEHKLQGAQDCIAKLQVQLDDERSEHEAILAAERLRHSQQLAENMQSSVKKLTADKLRCRESISKVVTSLNAEAQSLSQALASPSPMLPDLSDNGLVSPAGTPTQDGSACGLQEEQLVSPTRQAVRVPPLQLEVSDGMLSDTTAAPMQDASERHLGSQSGEDSGSDGCTSSGSSCAVTPNAGAMESAAATAALVAVAAAAAAATATRAAALRKSLTPEGAGTVYVHAEAASQGGWSQGVGQQLSNAGSVGCASEGRCSPAADMSLPLCRTVSASPSISSFDGSISSSGMHPAAAAAASAAAAAVAARMRSSQEQHSRQRRRRRDFGKYLIVGSWPLSYLPKEEVDMTAAAAAFNQLRGGALNVDSLQHFLEHRMLGGKLHVQTLPGGGRKRKHHLVQDMLAYHRWHLANCGSTAGSEGSPARSGATRASSTAATPTPRSSMCSSPESTVWHPLGLTRPGSAAPSSATSSPAKVDLLRYSLDNAPAASRSSAGGCYLTEPLSQAHVRAVFDVEASDANSSRQRADVAATDPHQQQQQSSPGRWSWLTPRRRKQQSILSQLQPSEKAAMKKKLSLNTWPAEPCAGSPSAALPSSSAMQHPELSVLVPERESEGCCDAVSPRDKKHAAAASRSAKGGGTASNASSQQSTPKGSFSLQGKTISACTGSAISEFYVDSPAVKLASSKGGGSGASRRRGGGGSEAGRLSVDLSSSHRSSWRQVQLMRQK